MSTLIFITGMILVIVNGAAVTDGKDTDQILKRGFIGLFSFLMILMVIFGKILVKM